MKPGTRKRLHVMIILLAITALVAAHGAILYYISHAALSVAVAAVVLVVIKHLGLFGPILAWFRRRRPPCTP